MKTLIAAASAAAFSLLPAAMAQAQPTGVYGTLGYAHTDGNDLNIGSIQGRLGVRLNPWLGVEGELAKGIKKDEIDVAGTEVKVKQEHQAAIYGVGFLPLSETTDLVGRVGYGTTKLEASALGASAEADGDSWNFGVGAQHHFDGLNGVRVDYTRHEFKDDDAGHANVWSVGYTRRF